MGDDNIYPASLKVLLRGTHDNRDKTDEGDAVNLYFLLWGQMVLVI